MIHLCIVVLCFSPTLGLQSVSQYARDVSEHCKRRDALPSVFLSRRVMEADAQVIHFSRLDSPYSCFTTVRTESGHSIIMVLDLYYDQSGQDACKDGGQLAVYDFAETFGGYWGPIPDKVLDQDPADKSVHTKRYTLAAKPQSVTSTTTEETSLPLLELVPTVPSTAETQGFINIDVPLVNLSASLLPDDNQYEKPFDPDEFFDLFYDVTPRPGQKYKTSILPLVQIAVKMQDDRRDGGDAGGEPRYELDYEVGSFTPDHRLTTPAWSTKINTNRNNYRWKKKKLQDKRVEPKTNNSLRSREPGQSRKFYRKQYSLPTTNHMPSYEHMLPQAITENKYEESKDPFHLIDDIMKSLNESGDLKIQQESTHRDILAVFNTSESSNHNLSVYLAPYPTFLPVSYLSVNFTKNQSNIPVDGTKGSILRISTDDSSADEQENFTTIRAVLEYNKKYLLNSTTNKSTYMNKYSLVPPVDIHEGGSETNKAISTPANKIDTITLASLTLDETTASEISIAQDNREESTHFGATELVSDGVLFPMSTTDKMSLSGTLVDHESWENVVQSAPVMAGLLNQHGPELGSSPRDEQSVDVAAAQKRQRQLRYKRTISAIGVGAPPQRRATARAATDGSLSLFNAVDLHDFARLMELPDDQMNNHVLIKLSPNNSKLLFDMCDESNWSKSRFLILFNSSRIILSIANFSMPHVMVALTTARPLAALEPQCPEDMVECQVEGTRVCIDPNNACDGVPNCGSAFAYDEDRVLCDVINLHSNVYLAAVTCLAVLVTMLYVIHYWLQRCVPGVAEAFFVYTDSADNQLYLDPIMRSPMEVGNVDDFCIYNSALFDDDNLLYSQVTRTSTNIFKRFIFAFPEMILRLCKKRKASSDLVREQGIRVSLSEGVRPNKYSDTGIALRDVLSAEKIDQEVQTGESLEMAYLKAMNSFKKDTSEGKPPCLQQRPQSIHEIQIRGLLSGETTSSLDTSTYSPGPSGGLPAANVEEREIQNTLYDPGTGKVINREILKSSGKGAKQGAKCLRFNEHTTYIPREDEEDNHEIGETSKRSQLKSDDNDEHGGGGSDFRKFFRKKKHNK